MSQSALESLVNYLKVKVPMARHFDIRAGDVNECGLVLEAPLALNFNDKQTAFAGTLASLCTLSGWAMTSLVCEDAGYHTDIAVVRSDLRYSRPCSEQIIRAHCSWPAPEDAKRFTDLLSDRGQAVLCLRARVDSQNETAVVYSGDYSAKMV
tara:strand:+ start:686 stop:1141 length:456 start_codon:yes stop_codon:yes gene_type:complete